MKYIPHILFNISMLWLGFIIGHAIYNIPVEVVEVEEVEVIDTDWEQIELGDKFFYFTRLATPKHFDTPKHYIWTNIGCYAFTPDEFSFEEIYDLVMNSVVETDVLKRI